LARPKTKNPRKVKSVRIPIELQYIDLTWIITEMEIAYSKIERGNVRTSKLIESLGFMLISQIKFCSRRNKKDNNLVGA